MVSTSATAQACANIAFIKYWGNRDDALRIPANGSLSMNLAGLQAQTKVVFDPALKNDVFHLNQANQSGPSLERVSALLDLVRSLSGLDLPAEVDSQNNFPTAAGIASSAAAFAALALAASKAAGLNLDEPALSRLARRGSGSACRSIPGGFVEWQAGSSDTDSYAYSIAPPQHWDLVDCIVVVNPGQKMTGSTQGHKLAASSPLQQARVADTPNRLVRCRQALLERDFMSLAEVVEQDSLMMHAVMMTSKPSLFYWTPATLSVLQEAAAWRHEGLEVCCTIDAGPNVHVLCISSVAEIIRTRLRQIPGVVQVLQAIPGKAAELIP